MSDTVSPLAPDAFPVLPPIAGVELATHAAGIKYEARADLFLASLAEGTTVAGTFTQSKCPSAPVDWCKRILAEGEAEDAARHGDGVLEGAHAEAVGGRHATPVVGRDRAAHDVAGLVAVEGRLEQLGVGAVVAIVDPTPDRGGVERVEPDG